MPASRRGTNAKRTSRDRFLACDLTPALLPVFVAVSGNAHSRQSPINRRSIDASYTASNLRIYYEVDATKSKKGKSAAVAAPAADKSKTAAANGSGSGQPSKDKERVYFNPQSTLASVLSRRDYVVPEIPMFYVEPASAAAAQGTKQR